jgi:hypothetical protein
MSAKPPCLMRETLLAKSHSLGAVVRQRVLPRGGIAILSDSLFYLLAL